MFSNTSLTSKFSKFLLVVQFFVLISLTSDMKLGKMPLGILPNFN